MHLDVKALVGASAQTLQAQALKLAVDGVEAVLQLGACCVWTSLNAGTNNTQAYCDCPCSRLVFYLVRGRRASLPHVTSRHN